MRNSFKSVKPCRSFTPEPHNLVFSVKKIKKNVVTQSTKGDKQVSNESLLQ